MHGVLNFFPALSQYLSLCVLFYLHRKCNHVESQRVALTTHNRNKCPKWALLQCNNGAFDKMLNVTRNNSSSEKKITPQSHKLKITASIDQIKKKRKQFFLCTRHTMYTVAYRWHKQQAEKKNTQQIWTYKTLIRIKTNNAANAFL